MIITASSHATANRSFWPAPPAAATPQALNREQALTWLGSDVAKAQQQQQRGWRQEEFPFVPKVIDVAPGHADEFDSERARQQVDSLFSYGTVGEMSNVTAETRPADQPAPFQPNVAPYVPAASVGAPSV